jgi:hypothetical protein
MSVTVSAASAMASHNRSRLLGKLRSRTVFEQKYHLYTVSWQTPLLTLVAFGSNPVLTTAYHGKL